MEAKYVVFKRGEFEAAVNAGRIYQIPKEVEDAVVMRRQDVFAAPAFRIYANSIAASLVVAAKLVAPGLHMSNERLSQIAHYFETQAELSEQTERKVPD